MTRIAKPELFKQLPQAVLFDTDNTLYSYEPAHAAATNAVREKVVNTLSISAEQFNNAFIEARQDIKKQLGRVASSHSRLLYFQRMLEIIGLGSQVLLALDFEQTYWRTFLSNAKLFEGVKELLDDLRLLGIPIAIVTDLTAQIQFRKIIYFTLEHHFSYIVTSEEAGADKPAEAPFRLALEKIRPTGQRIWMIGDDAIADIQGAKEAIGAVTIQKVHEGVKIGTGKSAPDCIIHEFSELRKLLQAMIKEQVYDYEKI